MGKGMERKEGRDGRGLTYFAPTLDEIMDSPFRSRALTFPIPIPMWGRANITAP